MLPVSDYQFAKDAEERVFAAGACVCGYFLFVESNHPVMKYMKDNGLIEMDYMLTLKHQSMAGVSKVGLYIFEPINVKWITHAQNSNNLWWQVFGPHPAPVVDALPAPLGSPTDLKQAVNRSSQDVIVQVEVRERITMQGFPERDWEKLIRKDFNRAVAIKVSDHYKIDRNQLPIVLFFTRKKSGKFWWWSFSEMQTEQGVINSFSDLLVDPKFLDILKEAE